MKHGWIMYVFLLLLFGLMARNAASTVGIFLGGAQASSNVFGALEGPTSTGGGSFAFGSGTNATKFSLNG